VGFHEFLQAIITEHFTSAVSGGTILKSERSSSSFRLSSALFWTFR